MKHEELKPFAIGYKNKIVIYPRMAGWKEESEFNQRFADISETDDRRFEKEFKLCLEAIAAFSAKMPERIIQADDGSGERQEPLEGDSFLDALTKEFPEATAANERIARRAYMYIKSQWEPDVDFV